MGPQRDGRLGRDNGDPRAGRSPQQRPRFPGGGWGGLTMMAMPEKSTAETNCQSLGRRQEESYAARSFAATPRPQGTLPSPGEMPRDGIEGKSAGARLMRWGLAQPLPITLPPPSTHIDAHLSPRGSRTANLISLPKTWLICGQRRGRGSQGEAVLGRAGPLIPAKPPGMPRDPPGYLC